MAMRAIGALTQYSSAARAVVALAWAERALSSYRWARSARTAPD